MNKKIEGITIGIMCLILTMSIVIQMNTVKNNGSTVSRSQKESDLKSQILRMKEKYESQYEELEAISKDLEAKRIELTSHNGELSEIKNQIERDNLIIGNTEVTGSGVVITLTDGQSDTNALNPDELIVHAQNVLAVVNELKNAGAEAISINGQRIVSRTSIQCDGNVTMINGSKVSTPIEITAIGLPEMLATLNRAGGTLEKFKRLGKGVDFKKNTNLKIPKYTGVITFKYEKKITTK